MIIGRIIMSENEQKTHLKINKRLCGEPIEISEDRCKIKLKTTDEMVVDENGLVHGGFIFGLANYAAMVAVNLPYVVIASADVKYMLPIKVGDELIAEASLNSNDNNKYSVEVQVWKGTDEVFYGDFLCIAKNKHVLG